MGALGRGGVSLWVGREVQFCSLGVCGCVLG